MNHQSRVWYVTLIAACYLVLASANTLHLASRFFVPGSIHSLRELLVLGMAASAWLYFFKPASGHKSLLVLTAVTIMAIGESDRGAFAFHLAVLGLLLLPFFTRRPGYSQEATR